MAVSDDKIKRALQPQELPKEAHEIEQERKRALLAKVRQQREDTLKMKGRVYAADPAIGVPANKKYVWVNRNEHRVVEFTSSGYTICKDPAIRTDWRRDDGTHQYGDLILMEIDFELWEAIKLDDQIRSLENVEGAAVFESFAQQSGIPVTRLS